MFNEYPIDIVKRNHAKVLDIPIPDGCSFEEKMDILSKSREPIHEGIRNAKSEMKSKIMDKTRAITLFDSLGIDKELQTEWINIIDEYCKEDDYKVIPYDWLAVAFDKSNTKLGYDISSILLKYNHYTYDLYGIIKLLPIQLFDNREFMKLAVQIDGLSISKNELYRNDDEIIRLAIDNDGDAITFLSEKYYRNEELVLLSLKRTWNEVFSKKEIRNYWKNNLDFAYKALNISSHYYKLFSTEIRNDDNFIKTAILKCAEENGGYYELYDYFSKENKLRLDLVIFALENDLYVDECELRRELRDSDELAEYCYKHDPNMLYGFSKRIRKKYNIKQ